MVLEWVHIESFLNHLLENERSAATLEKYRRDLRRFYAFLGPNRELEKTHILSWKQSLIQASYSISTINSMLTAVNGLLSFLEQYQYRVRLLKRQRAAFCDLERELSREEYIRLVQTARRQRKRSLALMLETICSTGIRVSELEFITVRAVKDGRADLMLKGKWRRILLPEPLIKKLLSYIRERRLFSGVIFRNRWGKPISRFQIWTEMKQLCQDAKVNPQKVFPHNLRHLFARTFYAIKQDLARLADVLGHSSVETTRLYIITTGREHLSQLNHMRLIT